MADPTTVPTGIQPNLPAALSELGAALLLPALLVAVIAYFCGCFNGAVIVSKYILRDDVRTHGSGNAGLTNCSRQSWLYGLASWRQSIWWRMSFW